MGGAEASCAAGADVRLGLCEHWICELSNAFDVDGDCVARLKKNRWFSGNAHALWRASENDGSGKEGSTATEKLDQRWHVENHIGSVRVLHDVAV